VIAGEALVALVDSGVDFAVHKHLEDYFVKPGELDLVALNPAYAPHGALVADAAVRRFIDCLGAKGKVTLLAIRAYADLTGSSPQEYESGCLGLCRLIEAASKAHDAGAVAACFPFRLAGPAAFWTPLKDAIALRSNTLFVFAATNIEADLSSCPDQQAAATFAKANVVVVGSSSSGHPTSAYGTPVHLAVEFAGSSSFASAIFAVAVCWLVAMSEGKLDAVEAKDCLLRWVDQTDITCPVGTGHQCYGTGGRLDLSRILQDPGGCCGY
jgi:hypothetical protein